MNIRRFTPYIITFGLPALSIYVSSCILVYTDNPGRHPAQKYIKKINKSDE